MKIKEFMNLPIGAKVMIRGREAKIVGLPQLGSGYYYPDSRDYGWATFEYLDTHRQVTKRNRQIG